MNFPQDLTRGDILLYFSADVSDEVIAWKEGDPSYKVAHIEIYAGNGQSWASRNGIGVNLYPFRSQGLVVVRRPRVFDPANAVDTWFATVNGTPYGWTDIATVAGLPVFAYKGLDCSHFASLLMEQAGIPQFAANYPKQAITPDDFLKSVMATQVYP